MVVWSYVLEDVSMGNLLAKPKQLHGRNLGTKYRRTAGPGRDTEAPEL